MAEIDLVLDAAGVIDALLPMFGDDLDAVDTAIEKALTDLISEGTVTERHRHECVALHVEILRRKAGE